MRVLLDKIRMYISPYARDTELWFTTFHIQAFGYAQYSVDIRDKVFGSGPNKICGRQPLKNLKGYSLLKQTISPSNFLKAIFHRFYLVHS